MYFMFTKNLIRLRHESDLSQDYIAKRLQITRATYIKIEKGEKSPTLNEAKKIAQVLGVKMEELIYTIPYTNENENFKIIIQNSTNIKKSTKIKLDQTKLKSVLLYVIGEVGSMPNIGETVLYKLLYFIDFDYYEKFNESITGMKYRHNYYGPTPDIKVFNNLIEGMKEKNEISIKKVPFHNKTQTKYLANASPDLSYLNGQEIQHINEVLDRMKHNTAAQISKYAHQDTPWVLTEQGEVIDYKLVKYRTDATSVVEDEDEL